LITIVSVLSLLHCAYSAAQHRFYLRLTEQPFVNLPFDVVFQTSISLVALIYGTSFIANPFQYIKKDQVTSRPNMRRSSQLSIIHHLRQSCQSDVTRIRSDPLVEAATASETMLITRNAQRTCLRSESLLGRLGFPRIVTTRHFSIKSSPFATDNRDNNANDKSYEKKKTSSRSPDFNNIPGARVPKSMPKSSRVLEISQTQANDAFRTCLDMIKKQDVDSYQAILTMNKKAQPEIVALNALNVELASIRDKVDTRKGDTSAMYRLQFWKDAISSIYGISPLPVPRQPVAIALCSFASSANPDLLLKLVETRQSTIGDRQFSDINALCDYGKSTIGSLLCLQIDALARSSTQTKVFPMTYDVAKGLGAAYAIANIIRATHPLLARGIVLLPADVMSLNGATPDSLYKKKKLDESVGMTKDLVNEAKRLLADARRQIDQVPKAVRPALAATGATTDYIIKTVEKNKYDIYSPHLQRQNPLLLWSLLVKNLCSKF
ncbi:Protein CBG02872, partial [Caenorhabditis briggsae]